MFKLIEWVRITSNLWRCIRFRYIAYTVPSHLFWHGPETRCPYVFTTSRLLPSPFLHHVLLIRRLCPQPGGTDILVISHWVIFPTVCPTSKTSGRTSGSFGNSGRDGKLKFVIAGQDPNCQYFNIHRYPKYHSDLETDAKPYGSSSLEFLAWEDLCISLTCMYSDYAFHRPSGDMG